MKLFSCKTCDFLKAEVERLHVSNSRLIDQMISINHPESLRVLQASKIDLLGSQEVIRAEADKTEFVPIGYDDFGQKIELEEVE